MPSPPSVSPRVEDGGIEEIQREGKRRQCGGRKTRPCKVPLIALSPSERASERERVRMKRGSGG